FLPAPQWEPLRKSFFGRSGLPADPKDVPAYLKGRLDRAYDLFLATAPGNRFATVDKDGWHLAADASEKLDAEAQTRLAELKAWLARRMRAARLPDLLNQHHRQSRWYEEGPLKGPFGQSRFNSPWS